MMVGVLKRIVIFIYWSSLKFLVLFVLEVGSIVKIDKGIVRFLLYVNLVYEVRNNLRKEVIFLYNSIIIKYINYRIMWNFTLTN